MAKMQHDAIYTEFPLHLPFNSLPVPGTSAAPAVDTKKQQQLGRKKPPEQKKLVPFTEIEWKYVQKKFMSEDEDELKQLCDIMSMWICRMWHDTPVFIGITELMLRALVLDRKHKRGAQTNLDSTDVGLIYGSVIIRFVNYINEICQPEGGARPLSISNAVSKMGIPCWVVDIRHQATHGQMPPMNLMKEAIKFCRKWLWRQHWVKPLTDAIKQIVPEMYEEQQERQKSTLGNRMLNALQRFRDWRRRYPNLSEFHTAADHLNQRSPAPERCRQILESLLDTQPEEFTSYFANICLAQFPAIEPESPELFGGKENAASEILKGTLFSREKHIDVISEKEQNCYRPIFALMNAKGRLQGLLVEITRMIAHQSTSDGTELELPSRRHLAGWATTILAVYLQNPTSVSIHNWRFIFKHVVLAPQFYRNDHIKSLLNLSDSISEKWQKKLAKLLYIRDRDFQSELMENGAADQSSMLLDTSTQSVKTLGDLQNKIRREENADDTFVRDPLTMEADWSLATPDELGAMGLTSDQMADTLCLALGIDFYI